MKRLRPVILISLFFCLLAIPVLAQSAALEILPEQIQQLWLEENTPEDLADALSLPLPDGQTCGLILTKYGWLYEYFPQENTYELQLCTTTDLNKPGFRFVLRDLSSAQLDGAPYPGSVGFDIVNDEGARLSFCYFESAHSFECVGYRQEKSNYGVMVVPLDEDAVQLSFYQDGRACGQFHVDAGVLAFTRLTELPGQPETAQKLEQISRETLAARQEGYTLRWYDRWSGRLDDTIVKTAYSKVENGFLTVRWVTYQAGGEIKSELTSFPIPLSKEFQQRLETESFDLLVSLGYCREFQTDDFLNTSILPVSGTIIQSNIHPHALLLLTKDEAGVRRLTEITQNENGVYALRQTPPLPKDVSMDTLHAGMDDLQLEWDQQYHQVCFRRTFYGEWKLSWLTCYGEKETLTCSFGLNTCTLMDTDTLKVGTLPFDLFADDLTTLPCTSEELTAQLDRSGLAVVCNPDPNDRLHLRTKPSREADSLGKFWNGTPVRALDERNGWCQVEIGADGRLTGWMLKKYLVSGLKMDQVTPCFSQQTLLEDEAETQRPIYTDLTLKERYCTHSNWHLMGVADNRLYVIVTDEGETGYAPMEWFFDGNG